MDIGEILIYACNENLVNKMIFSNFYNVKNNYNAFLIQIVSSSCIHFFFQFKQLREIQHKCW